MSNAQKLPQPQAFIEKYSLEKLRRAAFIFDFDGTLAEFNEDPDKVALPDSTKTALIRLSERLLHKPVILSGRSLSDLEGHFDKANFSLIGEHGGDSNFFQLPSKIRDFESLPAFQIVRDLKEQNPGSFIEIKNFSRVFHYRKVRPKVSPSTADRWAEAINTSLQGTSLICANFNMALEIKDASCSKLNVIKALLSAAPQFPLVCFGDDRSEQEFFERFSEPQMISIAVGRRIPTATYRISSPSELGNWLKSLAVLI